MKHQVNFFICIFFAFAVFASCGPKQKTNVEVGFLIHELGKERWENDRDYFLKSVQDLGGTVQVTVADNDANKQLAQAKELLAKGIDVLVVVPVDQFAAAEIVKAAHAQNVKVISYDRLIKNCPLDFYVSTDNVEIGKLQADYLTAIMPIGKYALIGGAKRGDIKIVYNEFTTNWEEDEGYNQTLALLKKEPNVDAILAGNDQIAFGVIRALREAGKENQVLIAGMDADLRNLQEIVAGHQTCTVYKPYGKLAATAAELAMKMAKEEPCEKTFQTVSNGSVLVPTVFHNAMIVNKENLKLTVISEGYQTEEEVYK